MSDSDLQTQLAEASRLLQEARELLDAYAEEISYQLDSGVHDDEALALWEADNRRVTAALTAIQGWLSGQPPATPTIIIEVHGGVAEVVQAPEGMQIDIRDFDTDTECPRCGETLYQDGAQLFCTCGYESQVD